MCLPFDSISSIYVLALHKVQNIGKNEIRKLHQASNFGEKREREIEIKIKNRPPVPETSSTWVKCMKLFIQVNISQSHIYLGGNDVGFFWITQTLKSLKVSIFNTLQMYWSKNEHF